MKARIPSLLTTMNRSSKAHVISLAPLSVTAWWVLLTMSRATMRSWCPSCVPTNAALPSREARSWVGEKEQGEELLDDSCLTSSTQRGG